MVLYTNAFYCVVHILIPFNFIITGKKIDTGNTEESVLYYIGE